MKLLLQNFERISCIFVLFLFLFSPNLKICRLSPELLLSFCSRMVFFYSASVNAASHVSSHISIQPIHKTKSTNSKSPVTYKEFTPSFKSTKPSPRRSNMFPGLLHWVSKSHENCLQSLTAFINHRDFTCYDVNCDINVPWYVQKRVHLEFFVSHEAFRGC